MLALSLIVRLLSAVLACSNYIPLMCSKACSNIFLLSEEFHQVCHTAAQLYQPGLLAMVRTNCSALAQWQETLSKTCSHDSLFASDLALDVGCSTWNKLLRNWATSWTYMHPYSSSCPHALLASGWTASNGLLVCSQQEPRASVLLIENRLEMSLPKHVELNINAR